jgi:hypothetical protein
MLRCDLIEITSAGLTVSSCSYEIIVIHERPSRSAAHSGRFLSFASTFIGEIPSDFSTSSKAPHSVDREENIMTHLEFCSDRDQPAIAHAGEHATIPSVGDRVSVPRDLDARVHLQVAGRQFLYDDNGTLSTVKLSCIVLSDDEATDLPPGRRTLGNALAVRDPLSIADRKDVELPFSCPRCACVMTLHQPDPELTNCLLAICEYCKAWYLTDPRETKMSLVRQPRDRPSRQ